MSDKPDAKLVRCAECGFLGVRERQTRRIAEAEEEYRTERHMPPISSNPASNFYEEVPLCLALKLNFSEECGDKDDTDTVLRVLREERTCDGFITWEHGFTPKEHAEMRLSKELLEMQREWRKEDVETFKDAMKMNGWTILAAAAVGASVTFALSVLSNWLKT